MITPEKWSYTVYPYRAKNQNSSKIPVTQVRSTTTGSSSLPLISLTWSLLRFSYTWLRPGLFVFVSRSIIKIRVQSVCPTHFQVSIFCLICKNVTRKLKHFTLNHTKSTHLSGYILITYIHTSIWDKSWLQTYSSYTIMCTCSIFLSNKSCFGCKKYDH